MRVTTVIIALSQWIIDFWGHSKGQSQSGVHNSISTALVADRNQLTTVRFTKTDIYPFQRYFGQQITSKLIIKAYLYYIVEKGQ